MKKNSKINTLDKQIKKSIELCEERRERHIVYIWRTSVIVTTMVGALFTAYWAYFTEIQQNNVQKFVIGEVEEIGRLVYELHQPEQIETNITTNNKKSILNESDKKEILMKIQNKKDLLSFTSKIINENKYIRNRPTIGIFFHFHILLIVLTLWGFIIVLVGIYKYHLSEIARFDNLILAYDRLLIIGNLNVDNWQNEMYKYIKSDNFIKQYEKSSDIVFLPPFLLKILKKKRIKEANKKLK